MHNLQNSITCNHINLIIRCSL